MESSMSKAGLDNQHRNKDGEISGKYGNKHPCPHAA
jgi:hypothetical protein